MLFCAGVKGGGYEEMETNASLLFLLSLWAKIIGFGRCAFEQKRDI
jgi:hypothetical protein